MPPLTAPKAPALKAENRLDALLDAAADAMVLIDERGEITRFNLAAQRLFGYAEAEVLGRNVSLLMPAPYRREHDEYLHRYQRTGERRIIGIGREVQATRKDGSIFPIELSVGEFEAAGEHGFVGILRDISARKTQEAALRSSEEALRLMFENAPMAVVIASPEGQLRAANAAARKLMGYAPEALQQLHASDWVAETDRERVNARMALAREHCGQADFEAIYRRSDGTEFPAETRVSVAADADGQPALMILELVDRSALQAATREAAELRTRLNHVGRVGLLGEMVSGIAHEVNQPLTAIVSYAGASRRMLASGQLEAAALTTVLEKISTQAERAGNVIRTLRKLLRRSDDVRVALDCNQLVREVLRLSDLDLSQSGIRLHENLSPDLPAVIGDGVQIQQVLLNLIRNALDAMQQQADGNVLEIATRLHGDAVEIAVIDCGPGLSPEVAERLFEPFFTSKPQGIGLGLSICQSIIQAHSGSLRYTANSLCGATFSICLPAAVAADCSE